MISKAMQPIEKRKLERFDIEAQATISVLPSAMEKEPLNLWTRNICSGGAFFATTSPLAVGTDVDVDIVLPLDKFKQLPDAFKNVQIKVTGKVLRTESNGFGVGFFDEYQIRPRKQ